MSYITFQKQGLMLKITEIINPGHHIEIDGYVYENLIRKPKGRSIQRRLRSMDELTSITIYT